MDKLMRCFDCKQVKPRSNMVVRMYNRRKVKSNTGWTYPFCISCHVKNMRRKI